VIEAFITDQNNLFQQFAVVEFMLSVETLTTNRKKANRTGSFPVDGIHENSMFPRHIIVSPRSASSR